MRILEEVVEEATEEIIKSSEFFSLPESEIFKQRSRLEEAYQRGEKLWVCPICRDPIKIRGSSEGVISLHFYHIPSKRFCPLKEKTKLSKDDILKYKYNGQKEGARHKYLKNLIAYQLKRDKRFSNVEVEPRIKGVSNNWRNPDVSAIFQDKKVVFEIQLSTTFLSIIKERNNFYEENKIYILWLFDQARTSVEDMRFSEKDIFFPNHHNAFFVDETIRGNEFKLICGYEEPYIEDGKIETKYKLKYIDFEELTFSHEFSAFYFNFEVERNKLLSKLERLTVDDILYKLKEKDDFGQFPEIFKNKRYDSFIKKYNINLNDRYFFRSLSCLLSLKYRKVVGYRFNKIIQVLHKFFDIDFESDCHMGEYIFRAIKFYGLRDFILQEDRTGKFNDKAKRYKKENFPQCTKYDKVLTILFPELFDGSSLAQSRPNSA